MRKRENDYYGKVKKNRFPVSLFGIYLGVLLLMAGFHSSIIIFMGEMGWNAGIQTIVPVLYWTIIAIGLTLYTRRQMRITYEEPMHHLAEAASQVAHGDFSVYVPTLHTPDKLDYLDVMIMDFNKMVEELGSIETLKTDFVSNVSHEMKTPIAIIKNYAELLQKGGVSEEKRIEYSAAIEGAATRLSNLITNILKLNKLEKQRLTPELERYDLCSQLCDCILQYEELWDQKNIDLEVALEEKVMIQADHDLLELVWNNLLSNAIKFTESGGKVLVSQTSDAEYVRVSVEDSGCGMSKESICHIFDKFYQGDTSHAGEGNGLGLALVKRVLELMDGDVQVFSKVGEGSKFIVTLPAATTTIEEGDIER